MKQRLYRPSIGERLLLFWLHACGAPPSAAESYGQSRDAAPPASPTVQGPASSADTDTLPAATDPSTTPDTSSEDRPDSQSGRRIDEETPTAAPNASNTPQDAAATPEQAGEANSEPSSGTMSESEHSSARVSWIPSPPRALGMLAGFEAKYATDVNVYGSDMATSFQHDGQVVVLFGDTYNNPQGACDTKLGDNDDMVGTLPVARLEDMPQLDVLTESDDSGKFRPVRLFRSSGESVLLDEFKVPISGFSTGDTAYAFFQAQIPVRCASDNRSGGEECPKQEGVRCESNLSFCQPSPVSTPGLCEAGQPACLIGGCSRGAACIDTRSSQFDGSARGAAASVMSEVYLASARGDDLATYDVVGTWRTNVFSHLSARTVAHFSGTRSGADYGPGASDLLVWGRPAMHAEEGRQAHLYFATTPLPVSVSDGELELRYYAGLDARTGEPRWSDDAGEAAALSMDGEPGGDPSEVQAIVTLTTVSWLGDPVRQWVMMYGGDLPTNLLVDPVGTRAAPNTGAIVMRFADHPWGPWGAPLVHLVAGSPDVVGDAYGPGGIMFHEGCVDQPNARCARSDPYSLDLFAQCVMRPYRDPGRLYAPAIVDAYTHPNEQGGIDFTWAVSTWLPYAAYLLETSIHPE